MSYAAVVLHAERGRGVALGIQVDHEHLLPELGQARGHVDRRRRLADAPLLVGHDEHPGRIRARDALSAESAAAREDRMLGGLRERGRVVGEIRFLLGDVRRRADLPRGSRFT
jgi:hypothetical protein